MKTGLNIVGEAETPDGLVAVVEDALNKNVYHVYRDAINVQPNHDAKGVMRYLLHVIHAFAARIVKTETETNKKIQQLEARVKLLEQLIKTTNTVEDVDIGMSSDDYQLLFPLNGGIKYKSKDMTEWNSVATMDGLFGMMYNKLKI